MLYLPGVNGRTGTIVPYAIAPGVAGDHGVSSATSQAGGVVTDPIDGAGGSRESSRYPRSSVAAGAPCTSRPCATPVQPVPWKQDVAVIAAKPNVVIGAVIALLKRGLTVNEASIRATLGDAAFFEKQSGVVTSVVSEPYECRPGGDFVPPDLLREACGNRSIIQKVSISGLPGFFRSGELDVLPASSDRRFWYEMDALQRDVQMAGLEFADVMTPYNIAWGGHMPRMEREFQIGPFPHFLAVAVVGTSSDDVLTVDIYQPLVS